MRGTTTAGVGAPASSITVGKPAGTVQNDVILVAIMLNQDVSVPGSVTAPDSSWTQDLALAQDGGMGATTVFHKIAGASESASYSFGVTFGSGGSGSTYSVEAMAATYGNVSTAQPIDVPVAQTFQSGITTPSAPSLAIPAGHNSDKLIALFSIGSANLSIGAPAGMTAENIFNDSNDGATLAWLDQQLAGSGATGTRTATINVAHTVTGVSIALAPGSASTPTPTFTPTATPASTRTPTATPAITPTATRTGTPTPTSTSTTIPTPSQTAGASATPAATRTATPTPTTTPTPTAMTPIKHLIIVVGENHSFDNVFAGYVPPSGQTVMNLLSEGVITSSGGQGANFALAGQQQGIVTSSYSINPAVSGLYSTLPQPNTTNANGQPQFVPDSRFPTNLPNGPFQITQYVSYTNAFVGDPVHRFFQMYQQMDEGKSDLFVWAPVTAGSGPQSNPTPAPGNTFQGALSMGYYNMSAGDAPHFQFMAQNYAMSDNYHQGIVGGSDAALFWVIHGDVKFYDDINGNPTVPPANLVEIPDPQSGTNNFYTQDGNLGGSFVKCSDTTQPGVAAIMNYLNSLSYSLFNNGNCAPGTYYLVNNTPPGTPGSQVRAIDDELASKGISFKYYGSEWGGGVVAGQILTDISNNALPTVSFVGPEDADSGHPAFSSLSAFETFNTNLANAVINSPLWANTAIIVTVDESGGYYDSGYVQPIDFFGDGPRLVAIAISPYAKQGFVDHTYYDHSSLHKFIEENWGLTPLTPRTRDNLPNPIPSSGNPYVPANPPAIGDLMNMFDFAHFRANAPPIQ